MRINVGEHRVHEDVVRSGRVRYFKINVVSARPTEMNGRYRLDTVVGGDLGGAPIGTEVAWGGRHCRYFLKKMSDAVTVSARACSKRNVVACRLSQFVS